MRFRSVLFLAALAGASPLTATAQERLTLEQASGRGETVSTRGELTSWKWAEDGRHLIRGSGDDAAWVDPETLETVPAPEDGADGGAAERKAQRDALRVAFAAVEGVDEKRARAIASGRVDATEDGASTLHASAGELWFQREGEAARLLLPAGAETKLEQLSPDGSHVAYVAANDLHLIGTADASHRALTRDGDDERLNGILDWVYQEEVYGRGNFKAFWWSPDSKRIAFLSLDESPVHEFTVVDHIEQGHFRVEAEVTNYPKAGDPNPIVSLAVAEVASGAVTWVDLSAYEEHEPLIVRVGWSPDSSRVIYEVQNRIQTWLHLDAADPTTGAVTTLVHERSDSWVNRLGAPRWLADGSFLWESERTGWKHVYHLAADGEPIRPVTAGEWALGSVLHVDEERGRMWFTATADGAVDRNVYRIDLDGADLVRLTRGPGWHSLAFDDDRSLALDTASSLATRTEVRLCDGETGEVLAVLARSQPSLFEEEFASSTWELVELPARDGFPLDAALLKPVPFDPARSYPVWLTTYSGPDAPTVRNRWNGSLWFQFLAQQGVIVFQVNVRTASGKGQWATAKAYKQLYVQELADLEDAVDWLTAHPWANAARVGITGYSYGGSMTAFALTGSDRFALGIAGGGVYDWRMYDTI